MGNATSQIKDPVELTRLAGTCCVRFQTSGALKDINRAVEYSTTAISLTPDGDPAMLLRVTVLATSLTSRYNRLGKPMDLEKVIEYRKQAISLTPQGDPSLPIWIAALGLALNLRFQRFNKIEDLDEGIEYATQAIPLIPQSHPDFPDRLQHLAGLHIVGFDRRGDLAHLDKGIQCLRQAVLLASHEHPEFPTWLHTLSCALNRRFYRLGGIADLDEAIEYTSRAVSATPEGRPELLPRLINLGAYLDSRFERLSEFQDLEKAIEYKSRAVSISAKDHPDLHIQLNNLGHSLLRRFEHRGDPEDLCKAVEYQRQAVSIAPRNHPEMTTWVSNLGESLRTRYKRFGEISDLDEAIMRMSQVLSSVSKEDRAGRALLLINLGLSLCDRFEVLGEVEDLTKSVEGLILAVSLTSKESPLMCPRLSNLSRALGRRYEHFGKIADLNTAIDYLSQAISLAPPGCLDMPSYLNNIGVRFCDRFRQLGDITDLHKAVEYTSQAVLITPEGHPDLPKWTNNFCISLRTRFERLGEIEDLEKAIEDMSRGISHLPKGHPEMASMLSNLGCFYIDRSHLLGKEEDIQRSIECFQKAAESLASSLYDRFFAARQWARMCAQHHTSPSLLAYEQTMKLLAQLFWLGRNADNRYRHIKNAGDVATEAAAAAIKMQDYRLALEWLEEGRSIVWKQMLQLRTPFDDLFSVHPALAEELKQVAHDLDHASSPRSTMDIVLKTALSLEQAAQQQRRLAERWEDLIGQVRSLPGFQSFLLPHKASELLRVARSGPVVIINVTKTRCDALVLQPGLDDISHVPLALFYDKALRSHAQLEQLIHGRNATNRSPVFHEMEPEAEVMFRGTMAVLWKDVVKPVIDFLGYTQTVAGAKLPHITWCTTGPLAFLPLHAAGDYDSESLVFNYVVSSYTPTLSALLSPPSSTTFSGLLTVGQKSTAGLPSLPGTDAELNRIQEKAQGYRVTRMDGHRATPKAVLSGMEEHSWVHLACHARQNLARPTQSAFYLHGGTLNLAGIAEKQLEHADLAFLSACQTATGDKNLPNEAVHLAAGMLMAGYRTVIATMWSIGDDDAPLFAEKVYEHLLEGGTPDARRAAVAVHRATQCLREKVGVKEFAKWVPYVHIGM